MSQIAEAQVGMLWGRELGDRKEGADSQKASERVLLQSSNFNMVVGFFEIY